MAPVVGGVTSSTAAIGVSAGTAGGGAAVAPEPSATADEVLAGAAEADVVNVVVSAIAGRSRESTPWNKGSLAPGSRRGRLSMPGSGGVELLEAS